MIIDIAPDELFPLKEPITISQRRSGRNLCWNEQDFDFFGVPSTAYEWDRNHILYFYMNDSKVVAKRSKRNATPEAQVDVVLSGHLVCLVTFDLEKSIYEHMEEFLEDPHVHFDNNRMHLHVLKVSGTNEYSIFCANRKLSPVTDKVI